MYILKSFVIDVCGASATEKLFSRFLSIWSRKGNTSKGRIWLYFQAQVQQMFFCLSEECLVIPLLKFSPCFYHRMESDPE